MELLLTKPISDDRIIGAKFLAGWFLTLLSLAPTLVYYVTLSNLAVPSGNVDHGAIWGSYIGLSLLSAAFVSIGLFASSLTSNQIIAFILAIFLSFFLYVGLESIASFDLLGPMDNLMLQLGMNEHYRSLSRGVIDTRDVVYFLGLMGIFFLLTKTSLESRKW